MRSIALPIIERELKIHLDLSAALVLKIKSRPSDGRIFDIEEAGQNIELRQRIEALSSEYKGVAALLRSVSLVLSQEKESASLDDKSAIFFKSSSSKKSDVLACITTNLQRHVTKFEVVGADSERILLEDTFSFTFGAPAAHVFGFSSGLLDLSGKVQPFVKGNQPAQGILQQLEHRVNLNSRSAICVSQALGALTSVALEMLTRCVSSRNEKLLNQFHRIGFLVHSVNLLSTSGKEDKMISDFAGAYEALKIMRVVVLPPSVSAKAGNDLNFIGIKRRSFGADRVSSSLVNPGEYGEVDVQLETASLEDFEWMSRAVCTNDITISLLPVLFNLGVNEMQTIANQAGSTALQTKINRDGVEALRSYFGEHP